MNKLKLYQNSSMDALRKQADLLAEEAVLFLYHHQEWVSKINAMVGFPSEKEISDFPKALKEYFSSFYEVPAWMEGEKIRQAQDYFDKEGNLYLAMLGFYSLPYCYAFADGAEVLVRSKRITDEIGMRLSETALFLLDCFKPGSFIENHEALLSISKVRLIHAFSRFFILKYAKDWDGKWGLPVNQEDMLGTNLAFSLLVLRGMEKLGKYPGKEVHESLLHYWKVIGFYLGIDTSFWPDTAKEAFELEKCIRKRHLKESEAGKVLIHALLNYYKASIPDSGLAGFSESLVSYFVGEDASNALGISQKVKLPKEIINLVLALSFFRQSGHGTNYYKTRKAFLKQSKLQFGQAVSLRIPETKRS
ncbi:oxygenase MpaB family protein [Shivajiella indica]|uniref:Oxygenase MpaB family protein n=1 Tax=Shivajiella indica TaxID=872115 RepID=A0ABW5B718_9BACT